MNLKNYIPTLESLRKLKPIDFMYPSIFILFFGVILIVFFSTMQFISKNINRAFSPEDITASQSLDVEKYRLIAKKLNISTNPTNSSEAGIPIMPEVEVDTTTPTVTATSTPSVVKVLDKKGITILIKNSTEKKGVAGILAKALENSGFVEPKTGNEPGPYSTTTILITESKGEYKTILLDEVQKIYPNAVAETTPNTSTTDAVIIIGAK